MNKQLFRSELMHLIRYSCIGVLCATVDFLLFTSLMRWTGGDYQLINVVSVCVAISLSFLLNAYLNFKRTDRLFKRFCTFFSVGLLGLLISAIALYILVDLLLLSTTYAKLISIVFVTLVQFTLNRLYSFRL